MIINLRIKKNISQEEIANNIGVSFQSINRWEKGNYESTKLAKFKLDEFFQSIMLIILNNRR